MRRYNVRVALGERWCLEVGDDLEVMHADRLADIEAVLRAWIGAREGIAVDAFELDFDLLPTGCRSPAPDALTPGVLSEPWTVGRDRITVCCGAVILVGGVAERTRTLFADARARIALLRA